MLSNLFAKKKKKILIIDDERVMLRTYEQLLSINNDVFDVITVDNRQDFLLNIDKVDAVVSDFHMSDKTKINFNQINKLCTEYKKPLLLLTGDIYPYFPYQLSKPIKGSTLRANILAMLERGYVPVKVKQSA